MGAVGSWAHTSGEGDFVDLPKGYNMVTGPNRERHSGSVIADCQKQKQNGTKNKTSTVSIPMLKWV